MSSSVGSTFSQYATNFQEAVSKTDNPNKYFGQNDIQLSNIKMGCHVINHKGFKMGC